MVRQELPIKEDVRLRSFNWLIKLKRFIWNDKEKEDNIDMTLEMWDAFSLWDKIGNFPHFEVRLQLRDDTPYHIMEDQKVIMQREMEQLEKWVITEKCLMRYSTPVLFLKRKQHNL